MFSALACMIRPTNAAIWVFLYLLLFLSLRKHPRIVASVISEVVLTAYVFCICLSCNDADTDLSLAAFATLCITDSLYYGRPIFTPYNFLKTNLSSVSLFYGTDSWHYYLTQALPILCTTALPFTLHGIYTTVTKERKQADAALTNMLCMIAWSIVIYSLAGHKEWRFIHPLLPLLHIFAAKSLIALSLMSKTRTARVDTKQNASTRLFPPLRHSYVVLILLTLPISVYAVFFYCSAPISVLSYLRTLPINTTTNGLQQPQSVGFLMPCHSTPGQAYLHRPTWEVWSLGCEPPLECASFLFFFFHLLLTCLTLEDRIF